MSAKNRSTARDRLAAQLVLVVVFGLVIAGALGLYATGIFRAPQAFDALADTEPLSFPTQEPAARIWDLLIPSARAEAAPKTEDELEALLSEITAEERGEGDVSEADRVTVDKKDLSVNENLPDDWLNVLLLATDSRDIKARTGRTDVMIIASIDAKTGEIKLSSLARDLFVEIPKVGKNRINAAYAFGGPDLAVKTVNSIFEMNIEHYVVVNFHSMASIVDSLGGVDIELADGEYYYINYGVALGEDYEGFAKSALRRLLTEDDQNTVVHLDGLQAVSFARIRKLDNDLRRSSRQRVLLQTMLNKVMEGATLSTIVSVAQSMMGNTATNVPIMLIYQIGGALLKADSMTLSEFSVPMEGTFKNTTEKDRKGTDMIVLTFNQEANVKALHEFIYGQYIPAAAAK